MLWSSRGMTGQQDMRQWRAAMAGRELGMAAMRWPRGISTNRWQAPEWARWTSKLGLLRANLVHRPKTKFALHGLLYVSYLRCPAI